MSMDETPNNAGSSDPSASADETPASAETPQERGGRMNAAKAFYRAMYAGEDVVPDEFGLAGDKGGKEGGERSGPCGNCAFLEQQLAEAQAKATENENLYKRMAADFENYRRRLDRERDEFAGVGMQKGIEAVLPAMDDLDRAKQTLANSTDPKAILDGFNVVYNRFTKCLENLGIKPLEALGEPFDPRLHEPVQEKETNKFADGVVMDELRRGYMFKDKVLRPTLVNVSSNPSGVIEKDEEPAPAAGADSEPAAEAKAEEPKAEEAEESAKEPEKSTETVAEVEETTAEAKSEESSTDVTGDVTGGGSGGSLDALNDVLGNLVGGNGEKGASLDLDDLDGSDAADKKKAQKVYDISDTDT